MRCTSIVTYLLLSASVAGAQPGVAPPPPPGAPPQPQPEDSDVDEGVVRDANSGRNWFAPTALTPPKGTWWFSDFELLFASLGYSITDRASVEVTALLPVFKDMPFFGIAAAKLQVVRAGNLRGAAHVQVFHISADGDSLTVANLGGALTLCIDVECHSHLTGYLGAGFGIDVGAEQSTVPLLAAAGATFRVGKHVKFVFEADTAFLVGDVDAAADGFLGWYGARFTSKNIGVDLGFARPFCDGCGSDELPMGFPFVSFTYRSYQDD